MKKEIDDLAVCQMKKPRTFWINIDHKNHQKRFMEGLKNNAWYFERQDALKHFDEDNHCAQIRVTVEVMLGDKC